jgi:hypothetical protein
LPDVRERTVAHDKSRGNLDSGRVLESCPAARQVLMRDQLSTQLSEVQRVSYTGIIGKLEYDRRMFEVLFGDGSPPPALRRRLRRTTVLAGVAALPVLMTLGAHLLR